MGVLVFKHSNNDTEKIEVVFNSLEGFDSSSYQGIMEQVNESRQFYIKTFSKDDQSISIVYSFLSFHSEIQDLILEKVHELKNFLTIIVSSNLLVMKLKKKGKLEEKSEMVTSSLSDIEVTVQNIIVLLNSLKNIDQLVEKKYTTRICDLLEFSENSLKKLVSNDRVNLEIKVDSDLKEARQIVESIGILPSQVLVNLVKNAYFSIMSNDREDKNIVVQVSVLDDKFLSVRVSDNGDGVPEENISKIFQSKFTTKGERGSGLGLSLSKKYLEMSGGSISYNESSMGGAEFSFSLPIRDK